MSAPREPSWFAVELEVSRRDVDVVSGALWAARVSGIEEEAAGGSRVRLVASVDEAHLDDVTRAVAGRPHEVRAIDDRIGARSDPTWSRPVVVGDVRIVPPGGSGEQPGLAGVTVRIDPGPSFGWGGHVTTRLALALLQQHLAVDDRVLDVGTGSGVLAIAAALLGASSVVAVDVDRGACDAARANVDANHVRDRVVVVEGSLGHDDRRYDVVVANVDRPTLVDLAPRLGHALAPRGRLVVSGFLVEQEPSVRGALEPLGVTDRRREGDWAALALASTATRLS